MSFAENLRYLRRKNSISQNELADQLGYKSFTTVQKREDGTSNPPFSVLTKLADLFHVSTDQLMNQNLTGMKLDYAPILGTVRGGAPILANQEILGYELISAGDPKGDEYFYLRVVGDSMKNDRILPGDLLYVHSQETLENGQIGVVLVDDEATVKRVYQEGSTLILRPSNDDYPSYTFDPEELKEHGVRILGKVISNKIKY